MKKLVRIVTTAVIALTPIIFGGSAFAAGTCGVGFTGPDSNNVCTSTTSYVCTIVNDTTASVTNQNVQVAVSGSGTGTVLTGSATNSNGTTFNVTVNNASKLCMVVATVPATVTPATPAPATTVSAPQKVTAKALPNTAGNPMIENIALLVALLGAGVVASRIAVSVYSRIKS